MKGLICVYDLSDYRSDGFRRYSYKHHTRIISEVSHAGEHSIGELISGKVANEALWSRLVTWHIWSATAQIDGGNVPLIGVSFDAETEPVYWTTGQARAGAPSLTMLVEKWVRGNMDVFVHFGEEYIKWAHYTRVAGANRDLFAPNQSWEQIARVAGWERYDAFAQPVYDLMRPEAEGDRVILGDGLFGFTTGQPDKDHYFVRVLMGAG